MCILTLSVPRQRLNKLERQIATLYINHLMYNNGMSNRDGYGLISFTGEVVKSVESAATYFGTIKASKWLFNNIAKPIIGHVRTASTGIKAKDGAHPFVVEHLAVSHNGTITNYRKLLKDVEEVVGDSNPVDTHVVAAMLAGEGDLTETSLKTVLGKLSGSYSFLILDKKTNNIWVVAGNSPLYTQQQGPLLMVNTSKTTLASVTEQVLCTADLFGCEWEASGITKLDTFTASLLVSGRLEEVCDLPKPKVITTTYVHSTQHYSNYYTGVNITSTGKTTKDKNISADRAKVYMQIRQIEHVDNLDIEMACFILFGTRWINLSPEVLSVIRETMKEIYGTYATDEKVALWGEVLSIEPKTPYTSLGELMDFSFPWPLNTPEALLEGACLLAERAPDQTPFDLVESELPK